MASTQSVLMCGLAALVFWTAVGLPLAQRVVPAPLTLPAAPALGWAVHGSLALPLYRAAGFTTMTVTLCSLAAFTAALLFLKRPALSRRAIPWLACVLAALLALLPLCAILPKISEDAVTLAPAIFDHSKVAIVDVMTRLGLPPANPFFGETGRNASLVYYYLWHFSAAEISLVSGITGWEADAALTGFTAFSSLALMAGVAAWIGGPRAALFAVPLAFAGSARPALEFVLGPWGAQDVILYRQSGLAGWLFQSAWAPQHIASATCILVAILLIVRLAREPSALGAIVLSLVAAAAFQSSVWVGGCLFAAAAPAVALALLIRAPENRIAFVSWALLAAGLTLILSYPFLHDQIANAGARGPGSPIAFHPYEVFGDGVPDGLRRLLDLPGYWLVFLPVEFPAIYLTGIAALIGTIRNSGGKNGDRDIADAGIVLAIVVAAGLAIAGYLTITFSENNDLGWRAALPSLFVLIVFAAAGLARWLNAPKPAAFAALALLALALPNSLALTREYWRGAPGVSDRDFAATPALWDAVRRHAGPDERVAINPLFMAKMTPWVINISWALLANRSSCYAGRDYMIPFTTLSPKQIDEAGDLFSRLFAGTAQTADLDAIVARYRCHTIVFTPQDGAWQHDPLAVNGAFALAEEAPSWKIYRVRN